MKTALSILIIGGLMVWALSGCGPVIGLFVTPWVPAKKIPAEHDLKNNSLLIWVELKIPEEPHAVLLRREMTEKLRDLLVQRKAAQSITDYQAISRFRRQHIESAIMTADTLGRHFQVDKVLYVTVQELRLIQQTDEGFYDVHMGGQCRLIDTNTGKRLWPREANDRTFIVGNDVTEGKGPLRINKVIKQISLEFTHLVGPCFYEHKEGEI